MSKGGTARWREQKLKSWISLQNEKPAENVLALQSQPAGGAAGFFS